MHTFVEFIVQLVASWWYLWIFIMMLIESSFIPFPSEVAMIPAGYLASTWEMNFYIALSVWTLGALGWASINYYLWLYFWEKAIKRLVKKYGKYFLISESSYEKSEKYFEEHGSITTFSWRFIPAVRQLISLPAWIFKMNLKKFYLYSTLWAGAWNLILMLIWYIAWENKELIEKYSKEALVWTLVCVSIIIIAYIIFNKHQGKKWK